MDKQILNITNGDSAVGIIRAGKLFGASQAKEARVFMGDSSFWMVLQSMLDSMPPMLQTSAGQALKHPVSNR